MLKVPILGYIPGLATVVMVTVFLPDPTVVEHGLTQHMETQWNGFLWGLLGSCVVASSCVHSSDEELYLINICFLWIFLFFVGRKIYSSST